MLVFIKLYQNKSSQKYITSILIWYHSILKEIMQPNFFYYYIGQTGKYELLQQKKKEHEELSKNDPPTAGRQQSSPHNNKPDDMQRVINSNLLIHNFTKQ